MSAAEPARPQDTNVIPIRHTASVPDPTPPVPAVVEPERIKLDIDWRDLVQPPDIWSDDRPSLRKLWLYGVYGKWTNVDGVWRTLGAVWATFALGVHAVTYTANWLVERFPRFAVAVTAITLAILVLKH